MRILWVKSGGLLPLDAGGKIRSFHILRELALRHEVTLFTFYSATREDGHLSLEQIFSRVIALPLPLPAPHSAGDYALFLRSLMTAQPYARVKYCHPTVGTRLRELLDANKFDVVVVDFLLSATVVPWDAALPKVIFTHNVEAQIWQRRFQAERNPLWKCVAWKEYRAMSYLERKYLRLADFILTVSETDRENFARFLPPEKILAIPTGVDLDYFRPPETEGHPNQIIFLGSMDWMPNEDAVFYFVESILPEIRREVPEVCLSVVGRRPSERLRALARRHEAVQVTGTVPDVRPYLSEAALCVVPLRVGSGTRIKIFEAMAMGKAVVSTSLGAEGLPVRHGENILLADTPRDFARSVTDLLKNASLRARLGQSARALVESKHGWETVARYFESVLDRAVRDRQQN